MITEIWVWIGRYGRKIGLGMISAVALYDVLMQGVRGFFEYAIGWKGTIIILIGVYLIWQGDKIERNK